MSGHSKWATTKRHKAAIDAKRPGDMFLSACNILFTKIPQSKYHSNMPAEGKIFPIYLFFNLKKLFSER